MTAHKATATLEITDIANGGQGIGRVDGKPIFVPYTIPGEVVEAAIISDKGRYAFAEGVRVLEASEDRVLPHCPHFGPQRCGTCHWQHMDYPAQLALKTDIVLDQLERVGRFADAPVAMALPATAPWAYQQAITLYPTGGGKLGYRATDGKSIIAIDECHIITPELFALIQQLDFDLPNLKQVDVRDNGQGERMVILSIDGDDAPELEVDFRASVNFLLSDGVPVNLIGETHLDYAVAGRQVRVSAGCFLRHNMAQLNTLVQTVQAWLGSAEIVLDLYAGSGILAAAIGDQTALVTSIDAYPPAMTDAEENTDAFDHIDLIEGEVEDVLPLAEEAYEVAIVDPPEKGISKDALDALLALKIPRLLLIHNDPAHLARDAKRLNELGHYQLQRVQPIDFEPQTYHILTLTEMVRDQS